MDPQWHSDAGASKDPARPWRPPSTGHVAEQELTSLNPSAPAPERRPSHTGELPEGSAPGGGGGRRGLHRRAPPRRRQSLPPVLAALQVSERLVEVWNDHLFGQLRSRDAVPEGFLHGIDMAKTMPKDSKGGAPLFVTDDERFIVKALPLADHRSLLTHTEAYTRRMLESSTLLCPIYLHFRFFRRQQPEGWRSYVAMRNLTPRSGSWRARYDLKACADDKTLELDGERVRAVHKRFWSVHLWFKCTWSSERWKYYQGKMQAGNFHLSLPAIHRDRILEELLADTEWLMRLGLMDYSLLVGIQDLPASSLAAGHLALGGTRCFAMRAGGDAEASGAGSAPVQVVSMGIIDFLQSWTCKKMVARSMKVCEVNKATVPPQVYGARFSRHFQERLRSAPGLEPVPLPVEGFVPESARV